MLNANGQIPVLDLGFMIWDWESGVGLPVTT
jgi:hypothetical protein